jgi:hypothetical protein
VRYLVKKVNPETGVEDLGTSNTLVREYASDENAIKYMLKHLRSPHLAPGQYSLVAWPQGTYGSADRFVCYLYKQA